MRNSAMPGGMRPVPSKPRAAWLLVPLCGLILFVLLYVIATRYYPGGSQVNRYSAGFSWAQNYWCNLLNDTAINGRSNPARPIALAAMSVLCFSLAFFWYLLPAEVRFKPGFARAIRVSGILSLATGMFLFTPLHDVVINAAFLLGAVAIAGTFAALRHLKWNRLFWLGVWVILLIVLNNYLYYVTRRYYLPAVQKITFLFFIGWIGITNACLYRRSRRLEKNGSGQEAG